MKIHRVASPPSRRTNALVRWGEPQANPQSPLQSSGNERGRSFSWKVVTLCLLGGLTNLWAKDPVTGKTPSWRTVATYDAKPLAEISGLAPSQRNSELLWSHNDSGGDPALHALDLQGKFLGSVEVEGVKNKDWEDMASFTLGKKPYLLIADTGDNKRKRLQVKLHIVEEPMAPASGDFDEVRVRPSWTVTLRYEDGPQDCESVAVDVEGKRVLLLNKDRKLSVIYEVPLVRPKDGRTVVAKILTKLPHTANESESVLSAFKAGLLGAQATALDIAPSHRLAVSLTYTDIRLFRRGPKESWQKVFSRAPEVIALPSIYQPEAVCFSKDGKMIYVSSEQSPTPLVGLRLDP